MRLLIFKLLIISIIITTSSCKDECHVCRVSKLGIDQMIDYEKICGEPEEVEVARKKLEEQYPVEENYFVICQ